MWARINAGLAWASNEVAGWPEIHGPADDSLELLASVFGDLSGGSA
jgi:hypothetical protein